MSGTHEALTPDFSKLFSRNNSSPPGHLGTFIIVSEVKFCILYAAAGMLQGSVLHPLV